jgi:hypothetical protein
MNKDDLQRRRNEILRLLGFQDTRHVNCIRIGDGETNIHQLTKTVLCIKLRREGKQFVCEAKFKDGSGRADVLCLDEGIAYEIVDSESEESLAKKAEKYPVPVEIVKCRKDGKLVL